MEARRTARGGVGVSGELTARAPRDTKSGEIILAELNIVRVRLLIGRGLIAVDLDRRGRGRVVTERDYSRQSGRLDAGKRADAIEQLRVKDFRAIEIVTRAKQIGHRHDYVVAA